MPALQPSTGAGLDDPRVYLAVERTYLAWIRTGLALMGFGFVVARFGIFLREMNAVRPLNMPEAHMPAAHGLSTGFGTALVLLGVLLTVSAVFRYVRLIRRLKRGEKLTEPSRLAMALGITLAIIGAIVSVYLLRFD